MVIIFLSYPLARERIFKESAIAIGFFDGIHKGHQTVIDQAIQESKRLNIKSSVMTFDPHPKEVLNQKSFTEYITPLDAKIKFFEKVGVDIVYIVSFTDKFARLYYEKFVSEFLSLINIRFASVGFDFTFGQKGIGKTRDLIKLAKGKFTVKCVPPVENKKGIKISSTLVREHIKKGNFNLVSQYLGRDYRLSAIILSLKRNMLKCFCTNPYILPTKGMYLVELETENGDLNYGIAKFNNKESTNQPNLFEVKLEKPISPYDCNLYVRFLNKEKMNNYNFNISPVLT